MESHIDVLSTIFSKIFGIMYKLRHYVPISTMKSVYFIHKYNIHYSIGVRRAAKTHLHKLEILQNRIVRACYFCSCY